MLSEEQVEWLLKRLELKIDAVVAASNSEAQESPVHGYSSNDLVVSSRVTTLEDPFTLVQQSSDDAQVRLQLVWETRLKLARSRQRVAEHSITFHPVAEVVDLQGADDDVDYLEPFVPWEPNVFRGLRTLPGVEHPYLPVSRLQTMTLASSQTGTRVHLKGAPSPGIRAHAAFVPRLKYSKINVSMPEPMTIATLDIEMNPFIEIAGILEDVDLTLNNGHTNSLMPGFLPMTCKSKDCIAFLYELQPIRNSGTSTPIEYIGAQDTALSPAGADVVGITIRLVLQISPNFTSEITTSWTTDVDFAPGLNPAFGAPSSAMQRTNKPTSLNFSPYPDPNKKQSQDRTSNANLRTASTSLQHQVVPTAIPKQPLTSVLSVSFTGPEEPVQVGKPFTWRVFILNNTAKTARLAIVPLPRIQRSANADQHLAKRHAPKASSTIVPAPLLAQKMHRHAGSHAKAVVEDHVLYALNHQATGSASAVPPETDIMSLTAELRIGPLGPKACHEAEIKFIAYKEGVFNVDAIRVVDLTRESEGGIGVITDIRDLPEIVVEG